MYILSKLEMQSNYQLLSIIFNLVEFSNGEKYEKIYKIFNR
jgi:hypothetical protein